MPIPSFREDGWLPEGHWQANWEEITDVFGDTLGSRRAELMARVSQMVCIAIQPTVVHLADTAINSS